jgi:hypothetical protein
VSARALAWAWEQDVPASEKLLLVALADECRQDGVVLELPQADLAAKTGAALRTVGANLGKLAERGLIARAPQFEGRLRVADRIELVMDAIREHADLAGGGSGVPLRSSPSSQKEDGEGCRAAQDSPVAGIDAPAEMHADARDLLGAKRKVDGRIVTPEEMAKALAAVAEFNRQADSDFGLGANLRAVVMRIRERPSMDAEKHVRLVQSAFRLKWWERSGRGRRPTPAVVYGNERVFEQVVQDAVDEAKGRPLDEQPQAKAKRFTRED